MERKKEREREEEKRYAQNHEQQKQCQLLMTIYPSYFFLPSLTELIYSYIFRVMTDGMKYCLATGNWGDRKNPSKAGVVQVLNIDKQKRVDIFFMIFYIIVRILL